LRLGWDEADRNRKPTVLGQRTEPVVATALGGVVVERGVAVVLELRVASPVRALGRAEVELKRRAGVVTDTGRHGRSG
jgi:hypothetical protein